MPPPNLCKQFKTVHFESLEEENEQVKSNAAKKAELDASNLEESNSKNAVLLMEVEVEKELNAEEFAEMNFKLKQSMSKNVWLGEKLENLDVEFS
jgi:hypothetical protein